MSGNPDSESWSKPSDYRHKTSQLLGFIIGKDFSQHNISDKKSLSNIRVEDIDNNFNVVKDVNETQIYKKPPLIAFVDAHYNAIEAVRCFINDIIIKKIQADSDDLTKKYESRNLFKIFYSVRASDDYDAFLSDLSHPLDLSSKISQHLYNQVSHTARNGYSRLRDTLDWNKFPEWVKTVKFKSFDESSVYDVPNIRNSNYSENK